MKIKYLLVLFVFGFTNTLVFAKNIVKHFEDMPANQMIHLDANTRSIMLKMYYENPDECEVDNYFMGKSQILYADTVRNQLKLKLSDDSFMEMKLYQFENGDEVIAIIRTLCSPICHSYIQYYSPKWKSVDTLALPKFYALDWVKDKTVKIKEQKIADFVLTSFIEMSFDLETDDILIKNNSLEYLSQEDKSLVDEYFDKNIKQAQIKLLD